MKEKDNYIVKKYSIIALLLTIFAPVVMPFLHENLSKMSLVTSGSLLSVQKPISAMKTQKLFMTKILNEEFVPEIVKVRLLEKSNVRPSYSNISDLRISKFVFIVINLGMLNLLFSMSFISYPQILISFIHKMDGKKSREYIFAS